METKQCWCLINQQFTVMLLKARGKAGHDILRLLCLSSSPLHSLTGLEQKGFMAQLFPEDFQLWELTLSTAHLNISLKKSTSLKQLSSFHGRVAGLLSQRLRCDMDHNIILNEKLGRGDVAGCLSVWSFSPSRSTTLKRYFYPCLTVISRLCGPWVVSDIWHGFSCGGSLVFGSCAAVSPRCSSVRHCLWVPSNTVLKTAPKVLPTSLALPLFHDAFSKAMGVLHSGPREP